MLWNHPKLIFLSAYDGDSPEPIVYAVSNPPAHGQVTGTLPNATYTPDPGYYGADSFTFSATNDTSSATGTITLRVRPAALIDNGTVQLGINQFGNLNIDYEELSPRPVGLTYLPTGHEATAPGCLCEGWGAADATSGVTGYANEAQGTSNNLTFESFVATASTATVVTRIGDSLRVTHEYRPSAVAGLYVVNVSIENISTASVDLRYRRVMDWDVEPTAFSEFVTIERGNASDISFTSDDGFASADPLLGQSSILFTGEAADSGPADHGALFDFNFGALAPGASKSFETFYGAASTEAGALADLNMVDAEAYSLGQPSTADGPTLGTPNTFMFAFRQIGGDAVLNQDPIAGTDGATVLEDSTDNNINVASNDNDPDGDPMSFAVNTNPVHGVVTCSVAGLCDYMPNPDFNGTDSFTYTVSDDRGGSSNGTVNVTVTPVNDPPVAVNGTGNTMADTSLDLAVGGLVSDKETTDADLSISLGTVTGGTASVSGTTVTFVPSPGFSGTATIPYTVTDRGDPDNCSPASVSCDSSRLNVSASLSVTVATGQLPPVAGDDASTVDEDDAATDIDVTNGDSDPNGDTLTYQLATAPSNGSASCMTDGMCTYEPDPDFNGTDSFTYMVDDGNGGTAEATVTVVVRPINDAPTALDDQTSTDIDTPVDVDVSTLIDDVETATGDLVVSIDAASGGTAVAVGNVVTFTPGAGFTGNATVAYSISDRGDPDNCGGLSSDTCDPTVLLATGLITIHVGGNPAPDAVDDTASVQPGHSVTIDVLSNDSDPEGDFLDITTLAPAAAKGTVTCTTYDCTYTANAGASGTDTFDYSITDGNGGSDTATVTVTIAQCPDVTPGLDGSSLITGYTWVECSALDANAVSTLGPPVLAPQNGSVALLTTGDSALSATANTSSGSGRSNGSSFRGTFDASLLKVDVDVPAGTACLLFDFAFESEEYPEFVNSLYNDAFLAELDDSNWLVSNSIITAPNNFAFGPGGEVVSVNSVFFDATNAVTNTGTTYDGSTPKLTAQSPITPGSHSLYLSIFDAGDGVLDSAALVDNLRVSSESCSAGVANRPPLAGDDDATVVEDGGPVDIDIATGDTDPDGDALSFGLASGPSHGTASIGVNGHTDVYPEPQLQRYRQLHLHGQ